jgi:hypothetical protein
VAVPDLRAAPRTRLRACACRARWPTYSARRSARRRRRAPFGRAKVRIRVPWVRAVPPAQDRSGLTQAPPELRHPVAVETRSWPWPARRGSIEAQQPPSHVRTSHRWRSRRRPSRMSCKSGRPAPRAHRSARIRLFSGPPPGHPRRPRRRMSSVLADHQAACGPPRLLGFELRPGQQAGTPGSTALATLPSLMKWAFR